jgi:23S rRNA A1618 N6-methylase RlmF
MQKAKKLTPGQKASQTRKLNQLKAKKLKPNAKQQKKKQVKNRKKKLVPFGGKVAVIANLIADLQQYGKTHKTTVVAPTQVVSLAWAGIHKAEKKSAKQKREKPEKSKFGKTWRGEKHWRRTTTARTVRKQHR